jgi:hypothetical protein
MLPATVVVPIAENVVADTSLSNIAPVLSDTTIEASDAVAPTASLISVVDE